MYRSRSFKISGVVALSTAILAALAGAHGEQPSVTPHKEMREAYERLSAGFKPVVTTVAQVEDEKPDTPIMPPADDYLKEEHTQPVPDADVRASLGIAYVGFPGSKLGSGTGPTVSLGFPLSEDFELGATYVYLDGRTDSVAFSVMSGIKPIPVVVKDGDSYELHIANMELLYHPYREKRWSIDTGLFGGGIWGEVFGENVDSSIAGVSLGIRVSLGDGIWLSSDCGLATTDIEARSIIEADEALIATLTMGIEF